MQLDFKSVEEVSLNDLDYGDVIVTSRGIHYLIVADYDGNDYRLLNLADLRTTDYFDEPLDAIEYYDLKIVRVIKSDNIEIREN